MIDLVFKFSICVQYKIAHLGLHLTLLLQMSWHWIDWPYWLQLSSGVTKHKNQQGILASWV